MVIFLIEEFAQARDSHDHADHVFRVAEEVLGEAVVFAVVGNENGFAEGAEEIDARGKLANWWTKEDAEKFKEQRKAYLLY